MIQNVTFRITMPKDFDADKLGFAAGEQGSTESEHVDYEVDGRVIKGSYNGVLYPNEGLTVRLELPEDYFVGAGYDTNVLTLVIFLVPFVALIISFILWYKFGMDDDAIETVEFYPPDGMNSLQMAFIYKGKAENKDVISLLVYLASKGYLKITEAQETAFIGTKSGFRLTKLKEYDGYDFCERTFLKGLFKSKNIVRLSDLQDEFYKTTNRILSEVNKKEYKNKIFEKMSGRKSIWVFIMILISLLTILVIPTWEYGNLGSLGLTLFLALFYTPIYAVTFIKGLPKFFRLFWGGFTFVHSMAFFSTMSIADAVMHEKVYLVSTLFGAACVIGMIVCFKAMPKRTPYGRKMYRKIKGFKNFLETAEKAKLEEVVLENPSLLQYIIPTGIREQAD